MGDPATVALIGVGVSAVLGGTELAMQATSKPPSPSQPDMPAQPTPASPATASVSATEQQAQAAAATQGGTLFGTPPGEQASDQQGTVRKTALGQ